MPTIYACSAGVWTEYDRKGVLELNLPSAMLRVMYAPPYLRCPVVYKAVEVG
jgi:hypothetical protein